MSYQRDFTIGLRETQDFYLSLVLGRWRKGIAGFGLVGALAALLYTMNTALALPVQAAAVLAGALVWLLQRSTGELAGLLVGAAVLLAGCVPQIWWLRTRGAARFMEL